MPKDARLFRIGQVARMFNISLGSLRHYERCGLLEPAYVDRRTGYRYYGVKQFEVLNTIRYLRVLDMPLEQIAEFLHNRDVRVIEDKLVAQKALIERKQHELEMISKISTLSQQTGLDRQEQTLLKALNPYLTKDRLEKLEKAMHAAKMAKFATVAFSQSGGPNKTGR